MLTHFMLNIITFFDTFTLTYTFVGKQIAHMFRNNNNVHQLNIRFEQDTNTPAPTQSAGE